MDTDAVMSGPPSRIVASADRTGIAVFTTGDGPPLVLVHGAAADHTTFRVIGPRLAERYTVHAVDRRGRGGSGDTLPYAIEREFEDVAAVAAAVRDEASGVPVIGHSYGGRCALGAALLTDAIDAVVCYEGAPTPPGVDYGDASLAKELAALEAAGRPAELLETFLRRVVGMDDTAIAGYQADPVWASRVAAAHTIPRELLAEGRSDAAGLGALASVRQPVLQVLGGSSKPEFAQATAALDDRLANGTIVVIPGARHAAHHTHPDALIEAIETFVADVGADPNGRPMGYSDRA
jgi:pimeloyl-ACP methyl ester carboxylesterase